jgi:uncharacterized membrane protein
MSSHGIGEHAMAPARWAIIAIIIGAVVLVVAAWASQLALGSGVVLGAASALAVREITRAR